jgi:hypothetical protein
MMNRSFGVVLLLWALASCRDYAIESHLTNQDGLVPPDRLGRYGREQAQAMAVAREFGHARNGSSAEALQQQAETAISYARTLPDVIDITADPLGHRLTIRFRSGWLTMVTPVDDGKRGAETTGLPAGGAAAR